MLIEFTHLYIYSFGLLVIVKHRYTLITIAFILVSLLIALTWVDYYRLIDIYDKDDFKNFIIAFSIGLASPGFVFLIQPILIQPYFSLNNEWLNDLLYCIFAIGLVEEIAKLLPFLVFVYFFRKHITEPIDLIAYFCTAALGFAALENVLYFSNHGGTIIFGRAVLSTLIHMICSSMVAYGMVLYYYKYKKNGVLLFVGGLLAASLAHGLYDFGLIFSGLRLGGPLLSTFFFLLLISVFSTILNNSLNNSSFFNYRVIVHSDHVQSHLLMYYFGIGLIQFAMLFYYESFQIALMQSVKDIFSFGLIVALASTRLSRFTLIKGKWFPIKLELPFGNINRDPTNKSSRKSFTIRGDSYNEIHINEFYQQFFFIQPMNTRRSYLGSKRTAFIEDKLFSDTNSSAYTLKVFQATSMNDFSWYILIPKRTGVSFTKSKKPIAGLFAVKDIENPLANIVFKEWVILHPLLKEETPT